MPTTHAIKKVGAATHTVQDAARPFIPFFIYVLLGFQICAGHAQNLNPSNVAVGPSASLPSDARDVVAGAEPDPLMTQTDPQHEIANLINSTSEKIDLGLANWLVTADIPQFSEVAREDYLKQLDRLTAQVRQELVLGSSSSPAGRCSHFVRAMHRLGLAYAEEFRYENLTPAQERRMYADPNNIFLVGLLRTRRGSCVSMPLIYLVIGQRLGLPVHLVTVGKHCFIRWEEPGLRMNIETTIPSEACLTPDDSVYLEAEGLKREQVIGTQLRNLTNREVLANLLYTRSCYWAVQGQKYRQQSRSDLSRAHQLSPEDPAITAVYLAVFDQRARKLEVSSKHEYQEK